MRVSGIAVPTAGSTLPTQPQEKSYRLPSHSTPFVKNSLPARITAKLSANCMRSILRNDHTGSV
ncbi:MAG: hypothetical protein ABSB83_03970 [Methanomassiliicoccales archaeon]